MSILRTMNICESINEIKVGDTIVIQRKQCKTNIVVSVKEITNDSEIVISITKNDYFNFDMYMSGESWVRRVWNLGNAKLTTITNNTNKFPR